MSNKKRQFSVAASPFNGIKLELAVILVLIVLISAGISPFTNSWSELFVWAFGFSVLGACWIAFRTHLLLRKLKAQSASQVDELD